jgi:polyhydroxyalkanoate synthesis regulator phasin
MDAKLEQLFYAVLGGALSVREKCEQSGEEIRSWQEKSEERAKDFVEELAAKGEQEKDTLRRMLTDVLREVVADLDLATKEDLEKLKKELDH